MRQAVHTWITRDIKDDIPPEAVPTTNIIPIIPKIKTAKKTHNLVNYQALADARGIFSRRFSEILKIYTEDMEVYIKQIEQALSKKRVIDVVLPAHTIKSSCQRMGAQQVADLAQNMEKIAKEMINATRKEDIVYLENELQRLAITFDQTLPLLQKEVSNDQDIATELK